VYNNEAQHLVTGLSQEQMTKMSSMSEVENVTLRYVISDTINIQVMQRPELIDQTTLRYSSNCYAGVSKERNSLVS
jgi:hypothetical protein